MDQRSGKTLPEMDWVFTGSYLSPAGAFVAEESGSILANYHDVSSVLDNPLESGQVDDFTYARTSAIPALGTDVEVRIVPASTRKGETGDEE